MTFNLFTNLFLTIALIICVVIFWYGAIVLAVIFILYTLISFFRSENTNET